MKNSAKNPRVVVLGSTGMLGSMVAHYFAHHTNFEVTVTQRYDASKKTLPNVHYREFDVYEFLKNPESASWLKETDYIVNCIGIIKPHCNDHKHDQVLNAINVNAKFPHVLATFLENIGANILQIATDCVYSGVKGQYVESDPHDALDVYGKTKSLGELEYNHALNIRCSIIGPERKGKLSLLEWFLSQPKGSTLKGFAHHHWNGVTTLQFAELCADIIQNKSFQSLRNVHYTLHYTPNTTVNKYELLQLFQSAYKTEFKIQEVSEGVPAVNRTLDSIHSAKTGFEVKTEMKEAIEMLANYQHQPEWTQYE